LLRCHASSVYQQVITHRRLNLSASSKILIQRQDNDCRIASITPLSATSILYQPICDRLNQLVLGIDGQQSTEHKRCSFDSAIGPTPEDPVLTPVSSSDDRRIGRLSATLNNRSVRL